jgi:peptide/nickel transport system substrate-binding protein
VTPPAPRTAVFRLQNPAPCMMRALSGYESPMIPKRLLESGDIKASRHANAPVGTGRVRSRRR